MSSISCASSSISSGPVANQMGRSNRNAFMIFSPRSLQSDHIRDVLVGRRFFLVSAFPFLQIPNFKTATSADECDLALQAELLAKILRQDQTPLAVGCAVFRARMQLARKDPTVARRDCAV